MAQTEHLPIYKAAYDLCLHLEQAGAGSVGRWTGSPLRTQARRAYARALRRHPRHGRRRTHRPGRAPARDRLARRGVSARKPSSSHSPETDPQGVKTTRGGATSLARMRARRPSALHSSAKTSRMGLVGRQASAELAVAGRCARYAGRALVAATGGASSEPPPARSSTLAIKQKHATLANEYTTASVSEYVLLRGPATRPGCSP
jgi:hypothetical protein